MYHIVYTSSATTYLDEDELVDLLRISRQNNKRRNITGLLIHSQGQILQVLEGEQETVEALFDVIQRDCRHGDIHKLSDGFIPARFFSDWSMAFWAAAPSRFDQVAGYLSVNGSRFRALEAAVPDEALRALVRDFIGSETAPGRR